MIVGVTVGCGAVVLVIIGTGAWFLLRRRQRRRQQDTAEQENDKYVITPWTPDSPDHSTTEYLGKHPGPYSRRYSGLPEI